MQHCSISMTVKYGRLKTDMVTFTAVNRFIVRRPGRTRNHVSWLLLLTYLKVQK